MNSKIKLFEVPFINPGMQFNLCDLSNRAQSFIEEIKVLIPKIQQLSCDLECEFKFEVERAWMVIFISRQRQLLLPTFNFPLIDAKHAIVEDLKRLPLNLNIMALETYSVERNSDNTKNDDNEKLKQLMKRRQKDILSFLLEDEGLNLEFPEMAPFMMDPVLRHIEFYIEYIHQDYFKIKLLSDSVSQTKRNTVSYLKIGNKISDDIFFFDSAESLRTKPKKNMGLDAYCFRDSVTNNILMYHVA